MQQIADWLDKLNLGQYAPFQAVLSATAFAAQAAAPNEGPPGHDRSRPNSAKTDQQRERRP